MNKIAIVVMTNGLQYDDRIRKVSLELNKKARVKIFAMLDSNKDEVGVTDYGIPFHAFRIVSRDKLPRGKFLVVKMLEFYFKVHKYLQGYDIIWPNEEKTVFFALFAKKNKFVWDLHELPTHSMSFLGKRIFQYIEKKALMILHANPQRIEYLVNQHIIKNYNKHDYIRNYPDKIFIESNRYPDNYETIIKWLDGSNYVYLQALGNPDRYPYNSVASLLNSSAYKIVVVGGFNKEVLETLKSQYGAELENRVFFVGYIDQLAIKNLLIKAKYTIVLYDASIPNNKYCEANRFYQAIALNVPVICGSNPPMKEIVSNYDFGISLSDDGRDLQGLSKAVARMEANLLYYIEKCVKYKNNIIWSANVVKSEWWNK